MDILGQLGTEWARAVLNGPVPLKMYAVRVGFGVAVTAILAHWVLHRRPVYVDGVGTLWRQFIVAVLGLAFTVLAPVAWLGTGPAALQVPIVTAGLVGTLAGPYFLPFYLVRTYGLQRLARRALYGLVVFGLLLQIAISGVT